MSHFSGHFEGASTFLTLKNQENPSNRKSHTWAPLKNCYFLEKAVLALLLVEMHTELDPDPAK